MVTIDPGPNIGPLLAIAASLRDDLDHALTPTLALIRTRSSMGDNTMAAQWPLLVPHGPALVAVPVNPRHAAHAALVESMNLA